MNITIINDCRDENAKGRQLARAAAIFKTTANFVGVANELEASGNLIDILDAHGQQGGIILVNVAPRGGKGKKYPNGTPFGYFWYKKTLVVSSIDGLALSLIKKMNLATHVNVLDIPKAVGLLVKDAQTRTHIINTQFRSYDFLPRVANAIFKNKKIKSEKISIKMIEDAPGGVWWVDNFGNCKTTLFAEELNLKVGDSIKTKLGTLTYYARLKDVPDKASAIITGSSGLGAKRFLEIVVQGESSSKAFKLSSEDAIF